MKDARWSRWIVVALGVAAAQCGSRGNGNDASAARDASGTDAGTLPDANAADVIGDASAATDANRDGAAEAGAGDTLNGTWRLVRYQWNRPVAPLDLSDHDQTAALEGGTSTTLRVNGALLIDDDSFTWSFVEIAEGHLYPNGDDPNLSSSTYGLLGSLADVLDVTRNANGTITANDTTNHVLYTYARTPSYDGRAHYADTGRVVAIGTGTPSPFTGDARFVIAWDRAGTGLTYANDATVRAADMMYAVTVSAPPADALVTLGGGHVAVGYLAVYDDVDHDGHFTTADVMRGRSPLAVAFRDGTIAADDLAVTPFAHIGTGFTIVTTFAPQGSSHATLIPFDPGTAVPPDVALDPAAHPSVTFPDLVP